MGKENSLMQNSIKKIW